MCSYNRSHTNCFCILTDAVFAFQWKETREHNRPTAEESQIIAKEGGKSQGKWKCIACWLGRVITQHISMVIYLLLYLCAMLFEFWADEPVGFILLIWIHKYSLGMDIYSNMQIKTTLEKISIPGFQIWVNPWQLSQ